MDFISRLLRSAAIGSPSLDGEWERYGDTFEGCVVRVTRAPDGTFNGVTSRITESMAEFGWSEGNIKWRNVRQRSKLEYDLQDLFIAFDKRKHEYRSGYVEGELTFIAPNVIEIELSQGNRLGKRQRWRRLSV